MCMIVSIMCACHVGPQGSKVHHACMHYSWSRSIIKDGHGHDHHEAHKATRIQEEHCASDGAEDSSAHPASFSTSFSGPCPWTMVKRSCGCLQLLPLWHFARGGELEREPSPHMFVRPLLADHMLV